MPCRRDLSPVLRLCLRMPDTPVPQALLRCRDEMAQDGVQLADETAWNLVYRYVLDARDDRLHIVESNYLRNQGWRLRAAAVEDWLAQHMAARELQRPELLLRLGAIFRQQGRAGGQENATGRALEDVLGYLISELCEVRPLVRQNIHGLRGFELASKSEVKEVDIALFEEEFKIFISCIWTSRKDRVNSDLREPAVIRSRRPDVQTVVVTNEFQAHVLSVLLDAQEVDSVYHVNKGALLAAHLPKGLDTAGPELLLEGSSRTAQALQRYLRLQRGLKPLEQLFRDIRSVRLGRMPAGVLAFQTEQEPDA